MKVVGNDSIWRVYWKDYVHYNTKFVPLVNTLALLLVLFLSLPFPTYTGERKKQSNWLVKFFLCVHVELKVPMKSQVSWLLWRAHLSCTWGKWGNADVDFYVLLVHWGILTCIVSFNCLYTTAVPSCVNDGKENPNSGRTRICSGSVWCPVFEKGEIEKIWFCKYLVCMSKCQVLWVKERTERTDSLEGAYCWLGKRGCRYVIGQEASG